MQFPLQTIDQLKPLIQGFRKRAGLTQAAMAEKLGITQQSYAQMESNLHSTSVERLYTILRLLNVELRFLPSDFVAVEFSGSHDNALATTKRRLTKPTQAKNSHDLQAIVSQKSTEYVTKRPKAELKSVKSNKISPQAIKQSDKTKW